MLTRGGQDHTGKANRSGERRRPGKAASIVPFRFKYAQVWRLTTRGGVGWDNTTEGVLPHNRLEGGTTKRHRER